MGSSDTSNFSLDSQPRQDVLRRVHILDTPPEESFDRLTRLAARLLRAPVALVSIVDTDRQFFKSCVGLPEPWATLRQTPLSHSLCKYVVLSAEPLILADAREHADLKDNGAVREIGVVAYAGIPIVDSRGEVLGSFCVIDTQPRQWADDEVLTLRTLASSVTSELELRRVAVECRAEHELAEKERSLSLALLESSREGICGLDPDGRCTFVNHAGARMLGYEPADLIGQNLRDVAWPDLPKDLRDTSAFVCGDGSFRRRDGTALVAAYSSAPLMRDGAVAGAVFTFSDVTERRSAERALRETNAILRAVVDGTSDAIFVKDADGRYVMINAAGAAIVDKRFEQILGHDDTAIFDEATARRVKAADQEIIRTGLPQTVEHVYCPLGGREITLQTFKGAYRDETGKVIGVLGIARDVTRRVRAEAELKKAKEQAESANRAKDRFLAVLSHELRSPLTPVLALASALENDAAVPPELRDDLSMIRRNVELEVRLIDDLLDLTRIARGKLRLTPQPVDAHALLRNAVRTCPPEELASKRLTLETRFEGTASVISVDPARFQQVMWNLLNNSVKFTPDGGRITVRTRDEPGGRLAVEVIDTGIGIHPAVLPRIFDAFQQGEDEVTRHFGGLGLGLAICKSLITAQGGEIVAASDGPGTGACFRLVFPTCAPQNGEPAAAPARSADKRAAATTARPLRILLVEDHIDTSRAMARLLSRIGHQVRTAGTVRAAVDAVRAGPVDLVISDLGLPDGNGHDLMRMLRGFGPVRGIALSGYGSDDDVRRSQDAGFDTHLTKPTDFENLVETIEKLSV